MHGAPPRRRGRGRCAPQWGPRWGGGGGGGCAAAFGSVDATRGGAAATTAAAAATGVKLRADQQRRDARRAGGPHKYGDRPVRDGVGVGGRPPLRGVRPYRRTGGGGEGGVDGQLGHIPHHVLTSIIGHVGVGRGSRPHAQPAAPAEADEEVPRKRHPYPHIPRRSLQVEQPLEDATRLGTLRKPHHPPLHPPPLSQAPWRSIQRRTAAACWPRTLRLPRGPGLMGRATTGGEAAATTVGARRQVFKRPQLLRRWAERSVPMSSSQL